MVAAFCIGTQCGAWQQFYRTCAYVYTPRRIGGADVDYVRVENGVLARRGRQGSLSNAFAHSQHLELLEKTAWGFSGYATMEAMQDSTSNEFDVGVYTKEIVVFKDGSRVVMPERAYYFARPEAAMVVCGEADPAARGEAGRALAEEALAQAVKAHQAQEFRTNDVLFVARWGGEE
jgi:hypothetical protein